LHYVRFAVPIGSLVVYDSRLTHRGSGNTSPFVRPTLYFSLMEGNATRKDPDGPTFTIRPEYKRVSVFDVLAGIVPAPDDTLRASHDDDACLQAMIKACPSSPRGFELYKCATEMVDQDESLQVVCSLESRMEKSAQVNIFAPDFPPMIASWGPLT